MYKVVEEKILSNQQITSDLFLMKVAGNYQVAEGQFFMIKAKNSFMTLFRPISIFDVDSEGVSFLYSVRGKGTDFFSKMKEDENIMLHGPYGKGFPKIQGDLALIGGGIGMAPLYLTAKRNPGSTMYVGLREDLYSEDELNKLSNLFEDVNVSFKIGGLVTEGIELNDYQCVFTCGPEPMMKAVTKLHDNVYISLEKHMGCGVGACLSCSCKAEDKMVKVCTDGPVFSAKEVKL